MQLGKLITFAAQKVKGRGHNEARYGHRSLCQLYSL